MSGDTQGRTYRIISDCSESTWNC